MINSLIFLTVLLAAPSTPRTVWCQRPLTHGEIAQSIQGKIYIMDHRRLRLSQSLQLLKKFYKVSPTPVCTLKNADFFNYPIGRALFLHPDNSLEGPMLLRTSDNPQVYLWYRGRVHNLSTKALPIKLTDHRVFRISRLSLESLPRGRPIVKSSILAGTLISYRQKLFIKTHKGLGYLPGRYRQQVKKHLSVANNKLIILTEKQYKQRQLRLVALTHLSSLIVKSYQQNLIIQNTSGHRLYLLKKGKRYYFWSQEALRKRGFQRSAIITVSDDELYLIPFAHNLY